MSEFVTPDGERHSRSSGPVAAPRSPPQIGVPLVASIPIEPAVSDGRRRPGPRSCCATPDSPAGLAFHALAARVVDDLLPPIEMAGCTARILELVEQAADHRPERGDRASGASGDLPGRLRGRAHDLAVGLQLEQVRVHLPARGFDERSGARSCDP